MEKILDGKAVADLQAKKLKEEVKFLKNKGIMPLYCVINIGDNSASKIYVRTKKRRAAEIGIIQKTYQLPADIKESSVLELITQLNADPKVHGMMVQLPVPEHININHLLAKIDPNKDIDGLTPTNVGKLWQNNHFVEPATPAGIISLLENYQINIAGKNVVIIGRSNIVGKPLAALMLEKNATVTILHSQTKNISQYTKIADILISATGQANFITADLVKPNAVVIDVGINRVNGHLLGDVDFADVKDKVSWITPVPGGVGPLTVIFLMKQVIKLARRENA